MQIVPADRISPTIVSGHRTGDITFQRLLQGTPRALDNFELSLVRNRGAYYTPRHRHNFDQVRMILEGEFSYAAKKTMPTGSVGYFPEGTAYGPQNVADCLTLILQSGAPSRSGFMSYDELDAGHKEMAKLGRFENGVFRRGGGSNNAPGTRRNQDGYEAIWEHVNGRPVVYPKPRYAEPVIMYPEAFDWAPGETLGIERKLLGRFIQETRIEIVRLAPGAALEIDASRAIQLGWVMSGRGSAGSHEWRARCALKLERGERDGLVATEPAEILLIGLPELHERASAQLASAA